MPEVVNYIPRKIVKGKITKSAKNAKNDEYQSLGLRSQIARMYLRGMSQYEIAAELQCSQPNISYHLKLIREEWLQSLVRDFDAAKSQELAKIDNLEAVAWDAFHRSQRDARTKHKETEKAARKVPTEDGKGFQEEEQLRTIKETKKLTAREQAGDPRFLERISWCIDYRCKLLGISKDAPTNNNTLILNFDQLVGKPDDLDEDPIERRIAEARVTPVPDSQPRPLSPQKNGKGVK